VVERRYDGEFYDEIDEWSRQSAAAIVPWIVSAIAPASVVDVGCGRGAWLAAFKPCGIVDVLGLDGDYVDLATLHIASDEFRAVDLSAPPVLDRTFDLAVSLEVAEHLPETSADSFVRFLTDAAPVVLFSGAIPGQGGVHHVNEQWPSYWAHRFQAHGHQPIDAIRPRFWNDSRVGYFFAQNAMVYARGDLAAEVAMRLGSSFDPGREPLALVHPKMLETIVQQSRDRRQAPSVSGLLKALPAASRRAVRARTSRRQPAG